MRRVMNHEIAVDVPDDWTDASTTTFVLPETHADVSLTHMSGARGMPLDVCAQVLLHQLGAKHPEMQLVRRHIEPGRWLELVVEWLEDGAPVRSVVRSFVVDDRIWTLAARVPRAAVDEVNRVVERTMASFSACERARS